MISFNTIIKDKFLNFLSPLGFVIIEDTKNILTYKSENVTIKFVFNSFAFEYGYFINLNNIDMPLENTVVEKYLKIIEKPIFSIETQTEKIELWATQKLNYFDIFKNTLLKGDKKFYSELYDYYENITKEYNKNIGKLNT